ncbi:hypothetical protein ACJX0J_023750, partial [Zea mays]
WNSDKTIFLVGPFFLHYAIQVEFFYAKFTETAKTEFNLGGLLNKLINKLKSEKEGDIVASFFRADALVEACLTGNLILYNSWEKYGLSIDRDRAVEKVPGTSYHACALLSLLPIIEIYSLLFKSLASKLTKLYYNYMLYKVLNIMLYGRKIRDFKSGKIRLGTENKVEGVILQPENPDTFSQPIWPSSWDQFEGGQAKVEFPYHFNNLGDMEAHEFLGKGLVVLVVFGRLILFFLQFDCYVNVSEYVKPICSIS